MRSRSGIDEASTAPGGDATPGVEVDVRALFDVRARRQRQLDVEAALAASQAALGIIPAAAATAIAGAARIELLDLDRMAADEARTGHTLVPLIAELSRVVGPEHGGWVHWGVTTQNIEQTAQVLGVEIAHGVLTGLLREHLDLLAALGERTADMVMAGRTHRQHAVPMTFGFKVAAWSDVLARHLVRLRQLEPRLLVAMAGGAVGTFAALGEHGPAVQRLTAERLGLAPMAVPARGITDHFSELVCVLGMTCASAAWIAEEVARLMAVELGEAGEPVPEGDVGSSTMPQKRNPKLCGRVVTLGAQVRALVPLALEAMIQPHEADGARYATIEQAVEDACVLTVDALRLQRTVLAGLEVFPDRMRSNVALSGGLISAEAVMMALGEAIGRQEAHDVVHEAAGQVAAGSATFEDVLAADPRVSTHLDRDAIAGLLDPARHVGLSARIAREAAERARRAARER